jgi:ADP-heptose:LPS heptosyltransferase
VAVVSGDGVLVARLDNCGDVLLAGPAVRAAAATGRPVHLLCGPRGRPAAEMLPGVTTIMELRAPWIEPDHMAVRPGDALELVAAVRSRGIRDAAILVSSHQSPLPLSLLLRWAGVARIAAVSHDHAGSLLDVRLRGDPDLHEVRRGLAVTESLGFPTPEDDRLHVVLDGGIGSLDDRVRPLVADRRPYVVLHPGATAPARTLAAAQWCAVASAVSATGRLVVVTGSQQEVGITTLLAGKHSSVIDLGGRLTFRQLATVLAGARALVSGNTGPAHLAAAVGTPVVAAFPPTVPIARWRPWRVPHVVLGDQDIACAGCRSRVCPLDDQRCVSAISGADVVDALDALDPALAAGAPS